MCTQRTTYPASANWATLFVTHSPRRVFGSRDPSDFEPEEFLFLDNAQVAQRAILSVMEMREFDCMLRLLCERWCVPASPWLRLLWWCESVSYEASLWGWDDDA